MTITLDTKLVDLPKYDYTISERTIRCLIRFDLSRYGKDMPMTKLETVEDIISIQNHELRLFYQIRGIGRTSINEIRKFRLNNTHLIEESILPIKTQMKKQIDTLKDKISELQRKLNQLESAYNKL